MGLLLVLASVAGFWAVAVSQDSAFARSGRWPRPMPAKDRALALEALAVYQRILADFFASGGVPTLIDEFPASKALRHRVFREVGFLRDRGLVQILDLAEAMPISAELTGDDTAEILLFEEWNWIVQRASDRRPLSPVKGLGQGFRYGLRREDGAWVVVWWHPEDVPRPATPPELKY